MPSARQLPAADYKRLKAAFRRLVKEAGGLEAAASVTRVSQTQLHGYGDHKEMASFAPVDVIADLQAEVGEPTVSRVLMDMAGEGETGEPLPGGVIDLLRMGAETAAAVGDFERHALEAAADGHLSPAELREAVKHAETLMLKAQRAHDELCRAQAAAKLAQLREAS